jgi:hypothetical protein
MGKINWLMLVGLFWSLAIPSFTQTQEGDAPYASVNAERKAFIQKEAELTDSQAESLWKLEKQFRMDRRRLRQQQKSPLPPVQTLSDAQVQEWLDQRFLKEEARIQLEKDFQNQGIKLLGLRTFARVIQANEAFKKEIIERLKRP